MNPDGDDDPPGREPSFAVDPLTEQLRAWYRSLPGKRIGAGVLLRQSS